MNQPNSSAPTRRTGICQVEIDGELVLLDTSTGTLHLLNRAAAAVWSELDGRREIEAIIARLSDAAGAETGQVRDDVIRLLDQLGRAGLLAAPPIAQASAPRQGSGA